MTVADVVSVIPAQHPLVGLRIGLSCLIDLLECRELFGDMGTPAVARAIQHREVIEHARVVQDHREHPRVRVRPVRRWIRQERMQRSILGQAVAQLLEVKHASGLVHALTRPLDRGQQRQRAGDEDAGGDGEVRPAKRQTRRDLFEQAHRPPAIRRDERERALRQVGRMFEFRSIVHKPVNCPPQRFKSSRLLRDQGMELACRAHARLHPPRTARFRSSLRRSWRHSSPSRLLARAICWSFSSAACKRDFTVPTGILRISAISRYFRSW